MMPRSTAWKLRDVASYVHDQELQSIRMGLDPEKLRSAEMVLRVLADEEDQAEADTMTYELAITARVPVGVELGVVATVLGTAIRDRLGPNSAWDVSPFRGLGRIAVPDEKGSE